MTTRTSSSSTSTILVVILVLITFPIWFGIGAGIIGLVIGFFGLAFGLVAGFFGILIGVVTWPLRLIFVHGDDHWINFHHGGNFLMAALIVLAIVLVMKKSK